MCKYLTNEEKELLRKELEDAGFPDDLVDYSIKHASGMIKFGDDFAVADKPKIKTNFCYGYGFNGIEDDASFERAEDNADSIRHDVHCFISENMSALNRKINSFEDYLANQEEGDYSYKIPVLVRPYADGKHLMEVEMVSNYKFHEEKEPWMVRQLDDDEVVSLIEFYEKEKEKFGKRLDTYLKKFGLSKVYSWTYLRD